MQVLACLPNYYGAQLVIAGARGFVLQTERPIEVELWMCVKGLRLDPVEGAWRTLRQQRHLAGCPSNFRVTESASVPLPRPPQLWAAQPVSAPEPIS